MLSRVRTRMLTGRGFGVAAAGVAALLGAQVLGRRDLLLLAVFLILLPLASVLALRLMRPAFTVQRTFSPPSADAGNAVNISLTLTPVRPFGGTARMREGLPARFGASPEFGFPAGSTGPGGTSRYEYRLRSSRRGLYQIGPVSAGFHDPFGLAVLRHTIGGTDALVVKPAPAELPAAILDGLRGADGSVSTRRHGIPSQDDVTTREYRHGDPMRRVHWSATARHGKLMVRQEETVTTPRATILLDQREASYDHGFLSPFWADSPDASAPASSEAFEWAVSAVMSIGAHMMEHGFAVRLVDAAARPGLARSPSAAAPQVDTFSGAAGVLDLGEGLAALGLEPSAGSASQGAQPRRARPALRKPTDQASPGAPAWTGAQLPAGSLAPFGDALAEALQDPRNRGPLVVIAGQISAEDAHRLAPAADYAPAAIAVLVSERPGSVAPALTILRSAGWTALTVEPSQPVAAVWSSAGEPAIRTAVPQGRLP
ncbi:DUF58 domain-containing protein [Arthrobacter sp. Sa2BUA2]|uniref:DUF58 domain-containing protein n=1 Tax=Arthrobacter pullicola TaxID=2762224 RepID=A0ABR8YFV3_9MICC|nr:DUF58 domain-containing protein [Arthrobacter pullicola]MBD8043111.1 DUF58 domain-containing protein [Arthrobacter pullicola]